MGLVDKILNSFWIVKESVEYFDEHGMSVSVYYDYDSKGVAGILCGQDIEIYVLYNQDEEAVASIIIHEISHERFNWKGTQEAKVNCYLMEAMHQNMGIISRKDIKDIVKFVRKNIHIYQRAIYMDFKGDRIVELRNGATLTCDICGKGVYKPPIKDVPANQQTEFQCSYCNAQVHILPYFDEEEKPDCLKPKNKRKVYKYDNA